ncbi:MAG: NifB/NifX family molybdenum-iron cluster-binding protein [Opitutaceae bacterium]|jgi:predicted Fe-Mo cluster-binding NifX family protein
MKIAIACNTPSPTSQVALRFGRAPWFLVYDTVANRFYSLRHPLNDPGSEDAGIDAARLLRCTQIGAVVAGQFGDSALRILHSAHICVTAAGRITAAQALADFKHGRLADL